MEWQQALALLRTTGFTCMKVGYTLKVFKGQEREASFPIGSDGKVLSGPVTAFIQASLPEPPPKEEFSSVSQLTPGAIVRNRGSEETYIVTQVLGDRAVGVKTVDITNIHEWEIIQ